MMDALLEKNWFLITELLATEGKSLSSVIANPGPSTFGSAGSINLEGELLSSAIANPGISTFGLAGRVKAISEPPVLHAATKINAALLDSVNCYGLTYLITLRQSMLFQHRYTVLACGSQDAQTNSPSECYVHVL